MTTSFTLGRTAAPGKLAHLLAGIGRTSYATYLWHFWIGRVGLPGLADLVGFQWNWLVLTLCYVVASVAAGFLLTMLIERPFLRMRDERFPAVGRRMTNDE